MQSQQAMYVPFGKLKPSARNVRTKSPNQTKAADSLEGLAGSIQAEGVLQNLVVSRHGKGKRMHYEVEAGSRRYDALALLFRRRKITKKSLIPVMLVAADRATTVGLAENFYREPMHLADELKAFRRLIDEEHRSIEFVAATFRLPVRVVERRLKLANLAPRFLDLFRADEIDIEQMMALAITEDHEKQCDVWDGLPAHERNAYSLRQALTKSEVDSSRDPIARYVTLAAYEAAGGPTRRDLFSDQDTAFILDAGLLHVLAQQKLNKSVSRLENEGWAWVETRLRMDYAERNAFGEVGSVRRELTKAESKRISKLEAAIASLEQADEANGDETASELYEQLSTLKAELAELQASLQIPDPAQAALAGAIITINRDGKGEILRGLIRPADRYLLRQTSVEAEGEIEGRARGPLSEALRRNLSANFTAALQVKFAQSPHVALAVLVNNLIGSNGDELDHSGRALDVVTRTANLGAHCKEIASSPARQELQRLQDSVGDRLPSAGRLDWLLAQTDQDLLEMLAICMAPAIDAVTTHATVSKDAMAIARATSLDVSDWWQTTSDSYLRHIRKPLIVEAVNEAVSAEVAALVAKAKTKTLMVTAAEAQLAGRRWVPAILRVEC